MTSRPEHTANLLGALALSLHDRTSEAIAEATGQPESGAAALSALAQFLDRPNVGTVDEVLGLTHSGAVRLIDRLEGDGYLERGPGADGRSRSVRLTARGHRAATQVTRARQRLLEGALAGLSERDHRQLDALLSRILPELIRGPGAKRWMCRLCDLHACGREQGRCPVANAAAERFGSRAADQEGTVV
jgi:DNA-binding MarR family transcriptional regulator